MPPKNLRATLIALCLTFTARAQPCSPAEVVFFNGDILTGVGLHAEEDHSLPQRVQAIGVLRDRITLTGTNDEVLACATPNATKVDLHGAFAMPGFNDAHTHMAQAGQQRLAVNLVGASSLADMQTRIRTYVANAKPGQWILGGGWDHTLWPDKMLPTAADLDAVTGNHPAYFDRVDGHIAVLNTAALHAAGITATTPDPKGGKIDHTSAGAPTGIIREAPALALIEKVVPKPDYDTRKRALQLSIDDALAHGVTSVQDFSDWDDWLVLEELEHIGKLPLRFAEWIAFDTPLPILQQRRASHPADDPLLHLTQLKAFMDGSLGSRTAALEDPYTDDPTNAGLPRYDQSKLNQLSAERAQAGFQLGFHAIGDRANNMALNAFEAADNAEQQRLGQLVDACLKQHPEVRGMADSCGRFPKAPLSSIDRFRIEHAQVVTPDAFNRFARLRAIASMQPSHLLTDMAWAGDRLGPERSKYAYAWRSFLNHHVTLAFGTDYPVESINPFRGLYAAVTRQNEAGAQTFHPEQKLTLNEALYAYTQASAYAEFRENIKGRLEPGYLADLIVLDRDITTATPQDLLHTRVLRTVVGGTTRYVAPAPPLHPAETISRP